MALDPAVDWSVNATSSGTVPETGVAENAAVGAVLGAGLGQPDKERRKSETRRNERARHGVDRIGGTFSVQARAPSQNPRIGSYAQPKVRKSSTSSGLKATGLPPGTPDASVRRMGAEKQTVIY